jgi:HEAT repeat protein
VDPLAGVVLDDSDWEVRAEAARRLGDSGRPEALPALEAAAADPNEFVRAAASAARRKLAR